MRPEPSPAEPPLWLGLDAAASGEGRCFRYRLAGLSVLADQPLPGCGPAGVEQAAGRPGLEVEPRSGHQTFSGKASLGGRERRLSAWWHGGRCWLEVEDGGAWGIELTQGRACHRGSPASPTAGLGEIALGPPLLLLLAARGIFALHASAAAVAGQLCLFLGASGAGKSTLAAAAAPGWRRLADDLVPVTLAGTRVEARLRFPQLKLGEEPLETPERLPLRGFYQLERRRGDGGIAVHRLAGSEAVATLVEHTMVGRLFPPALLAAHLDWAAQVASAVPVYRLSYPNGLEHLGALRQALADSLRPSSSAPHEQRAG